MPATVVLVACADCIVNLLIHLPVVMWSRGRISLIGYHQRKVLSGYEDSVSLQQLRTAFYHSRYGYQFPISLYTRACLKYMPIYAIISYASSVGLTLYANFTQKCIS